MPADVSKCNKKNIRERGNEKFTGINKLKNKQMCIMNYNRDIVYNRLQIETMRTVK